MNSVLAAHEEFEQYHLMCGRTITPHWVAELIVFSNSQPKEKSPILERMGLKNMPAIT
jgi:hypothetical protein